jgi:pyruvate-ferredoxin/flavodoxin oxidoreductase
MAVRSTGFGLMSSNSVQEAMDIALIAGVSSLESRVPFLHFFDGFRTSHEVAKVELLEDDDIRAMVDGDSVRAHRERGMTPDNPVTRGTAQNPDTFFQARERINPFYHDCPEIVERVMRRFEKIVGRVYNLFEYEGAPDAEYVIAVMGSAAETVSETVTHLVAQGAKVGLLKIRLYRPFSVTHFINALPESARVVCALDRTKEPGSIGEPMYEDIISAFYEHAEAGGERFKKIPRIIGGRYGLSSKEFTPGMVVSVFENMRGKEPKNHFTVGIDDDVTRTSIDFDPSYVIEKPGQTRAVFFGLGADGTVSANKSSIKIIGEETENNAQGYFVYDSRKAGSLTVSHLRFGSEQIHSPYLINRANFVACHQFPFMERLNILKVAEPGATFLLNSPFPTEETWDMLPRQVQQQIIDKRLKFYVIDAYKIAREIGLGSRINTIMQTCFFILSGILPRNEAIERIKHFTKKAYGSRGEKILEMNYRAVDMAPDHLHEITYPDTVTSTRDMLPPVAEEAPPYVRDVIGRMIAKEGDELPVSAFDPDGTFPSGTTKWEKRNIALEIPAWDPDTCIQCGRCVLVCPHAVIRSKVYDSAILASAPATFKSTAAKAKDYSGLTYTIQVSPEDCTQCGLCVRACPAKNKQEPDKKAINMVSQPPIREQEKENWEFFLSIPYIDRNKVNRTVTRGVQFLEPLFEFSGACAGCGETPYVKLLSQLFGDRALIGNATGCSSIYGGNLPATPWAKNDAGRGVAWNNSLFEDIAEFGYGMRLALDQQHEYARILIGRLESEIGGELAKSLLNADQSTEPGIMEQRARIEALKKELKGLDSSDAKDLLGIADVLAKKSVWILGGDGWAYDIGYGGLDHVIAQKRNVNILVMDTETYSNTGGQMSKATPLGAVAKFAAAGKRTPKKDLAWMAMSYGNAYVARIALGANEGQTIKAFLEAEAYDGPSIIIAYCHCIGQGYNLINGLKQQKLAVKSGYWPLIRYNPELLKEGKNPLQLDSKGPSIPLEEYIYNENRYNILRHTIPDEAAELLKEAQADVNRRWRLYEHMAALTFNGDE